MSHEVPTNIHFKQMWHLIFGASIIMFCFFRSKIERAAILNWNNPYSESSAWIPEKFPSTFFNFKQMWHLLFLALQSFSASTVAIWEPYSAISRKNHGESFGLGFKWNSSSTVALQDFRSPPALATEQSVMSSKYFRQPGTFSRTPKSNQESMSSATEDCRFGRRMLTIKNI